MENLTLSQSPSRRSLTVKRQKKECLPMINSNKFHLCDIDSIRFPNLTFIGTIENRKSSINPFIQRTKCQKKSRKNKYNTFNINLFTCSFGTAGSTIATARCIKF